MYGEMKPEIFNYCKKMYGENISIKALEDKNSTFDVLAHDRNINIPIEYKERFFDESKKKFLFEYDILIELIQGVKELSKYDLAGLTNQNINTKIRSERINVIIGWFYKCSAKRLLYIRWLGDSIFDIMDIDFEPFKNWLFNNLAQFKLQWAGGTTGTINLKVKYSEIPKVMYHYEKRKE